MTFQPRYLTQAECRYMIDAAQGLTAQQSADRHGVSLGTVNTTRQHVQRVLGARNITHAVVLALHHGNFTFDEI